MSFPRKTQLLIVFILLITSSSFSQKLAKDVIRFSGIIKKITPSPDGMKQITVSFPSESSDQPLQIPLDENDSFQVDIKGLEGLYTVSDGNFPYELYFRPGKSYTIQYTFNPEKMLLGKDVKIGGYESPINQYFITKNQEKTFFNPGEESLEKEYTQKLANWKKNELKRVSNFQLPTTISANEKKRIEFEYLFNLFLYSRFNEMRDSTFQPSQQVLSILNIDYNNEKEYHKYSLYRRLVYEYYLKQLESIEKDSLKVNPTFDLRQNRIRLISKIVPNDYIRNSIISDIVIYDLKEVKNIEIYYSDFIEKYTGENSKRKEEALDVYLRLTKLKKGTSSPLFFDYTNFKGGKNSLEDFKGKYVFIDIWATWCGNCWNEFPFIRKMEEKYKDKNIVFLSISMDEDKQKWIKTIEKEHLPGIQLLFNGKNDSFIKEFAVYGIPRYILIDTEQKIINYSTARPSDVKLISQLFKEIGF
jgi:thiol-disulfide isomerase/thioredoxin